MVVSAQKIFLVREGLLSMRKVCPFCCKDIKIIHQLFHHSLITYIYIYFDRFLNWFGCLDYLLGDPNHNLQIIICKNGSAPSKIIFNVMQLSFSLKDFNGLLSFSLKDFNGLFG
jgi:hypothetical protein